MDLVANNLSYKPDDQYHLNEVSFNFKEGNLYTILGRTLSGKTTLLKTIAGLLTPDSGEIEFDGKNFLKIPVWERNVAMVYQQFINYPHLNVFENIAFPLKQRKIDQSIIKEKVMDALKSVGLLGYENRKTFSFKSPSDLDLQECFDFILSRNIDEVYCSANELEENQLNLLIEFCENNFKILKFISKRGGLLSKKLKTDTYGLSTVQSLRQMPLSNDYNTLVKRFFDIVFSLFIIMFFLSWITPIIALLIKIESSGPVFFKQTRNGIKYKEFTCYKFRSMVENIDADIQQATKNDKRVTKVGKILRKTSLDELPQFYNVLIGNMSVVGPRPHMIKENERYSKSVNKFMVRHFVKPGITGLAQVKGFRGEIETNEDIINRVKFDIYYLENWSLILDLNIVFLTAINFLTGHKKAY